MTRARRILIGLAAATGSIGLVLVLLVLGSAGEGPLSHALERIGGGVSRLEARVLGGLRGPGRAARLEWLDHLREAEALKRPDTLLIGAFDPQATTTLEGITRLENSLGTTLPLIHVYTAWGDRPDQRFPRRVLEAITRLGSIPVVTWEPWLTDFENTLHPHLPLRDDRDRGGLAAIANGEYDFHIDAWARDAAAFRDPIMLRFAHEFNDPYRYAWGPQNNGPADFIAAWRRVVQRFRAAGADNVLWVWSPHVAYTGYEAYYPGDGVVDWVATGALNYGTVANWSQWWSFDDIFGRHYDFLAGFGRPIMIAEFASLAVGGDRAAWYRDALTHFPQRFPAVRALLFFNVPADATVTYQALDWSVDEDDATLRAMRAALGTAAATRP